eukprot:Skav213026  [mRNA]  locus=scaffold2312:346022:347740:- [translate_table: standard]
MRSICVFAFMLSLAEAARPMLSSMATLQGGAEVVLHQADAVSDECKNRHATISGPDKCECDVGFAANEHCPEEYIGKDHFSLSKETSSQCMCQIHECHKKYKARHQFWQKGRRMCKCRQFPHTLCGVPWGSKAAFPLQPAKKGCKCLLPGELNEFRPMAPVRVAALNLCKVFLEKSFPPLTSNMCKKVVAEGMAPPGQEWLRELKDTSKQEHQGYGCLDPLVPGTAVHHHLKHVCQDECESLVKKIKDGRVLREMIADVSRHGAPYEETCADRVVRQVEADVLGCCADSCGYNGKSCMAWPFFTKAEKVTWLEECCTEYNVLSGSPRETMCNSVLTPDQAEKVSATDIKPLNSSTDVGEPYIGQGPLLLWTEAGVKSEVGKFYSQIPNPPKPNGPVSSQVMEEHPHIRAEGLKNKWFKQTNITQSDSQSRATSFMEARRNACDFSKAAHCTDTFKKMKQESCVKQRKWKVSEQDGEGCPKDNVQRMATPEDCLTAFPNEPKVKSFFFEFANEGQQEDKKLLDEKSLATPINCYVDTTECGKHVEKILITEINEEDLPSLKESTFWFDAEDLP